MEFQSRSMQSSYFFVESHKNKNVFNTDIITWDKLFGDIPCAPPVIDRDPCRRQGSYNLGSKFS